MVKKNTTINRKIKDAFMQTLIYLSALFTIAILVVIIGFIVIRGLPGINKDFLTNQWEEKTTFVYVIKNEETSTIMAKATHTLDSMGYVNSLGITLGIDKEKNIYIEDLDEKSSVKNALDLKGRYYQVKKGDRITKVDSIRFDDVTLEEALVAFEQAPGTMKVKVVRPGEGIVPMLVSTIYLIILSLVISAPVGILSAIYLNEYAKPGRILTLIRFAILNLAGIPSIIYGLFGMLVFVQLLKMQYSILAGALTMSIILLPTIISTTEEALKAIPQTYRESSLGLGATKLQTNYKVVLPNAIPGIIVAIILSIGRIVGESAALMLTAGTVAQIPNALTGNTASAATLTTKLYWVMKEKGDISTACSIAIILLLLIISLNVASTFVMKHFLTK